MDSVEKTGSGDKMGRGDSAMCKLHNSGDRVNSGGKAGLLCSAAAASGGGRAREGGGSWSGLADS